MITIEKYQGTHIPLVRVRVARDRYLRVDTDGMSAASLEMSSAFVHVDTAESMALAFMWGELQQAGLCRRCLTQGEA